MVTIEAKNSSNCIVTNTIVKRYDSQTGNKILNDYLILEEIGRGVHGKVKLARHMKSNQLVAIKIVDKNVRKRQMGYLRGSRDTEKIVEKEISILKKCNHPNIVKLYEVIDPGHRKAYMALEYTEKGDIKWRDDFERPVLSIDQSRKYFRDILSGLHYCVIHRDLKPANLLLSHDGVVKISDFGVSYYNEMLSSNRESNYGALQKIDKELTETAGTPAFFAPELCCTHYTSKPKISKQIDIWALGVTLYCFVFGRCPFSGVTEFELFDSIPTQILKFPSADEVGFEVEHNLKDLLNKLLTKDPSKRITIEKIKRHPWVTADVPDIEDWIKRSNPKTYIESNLNIPENITIMNRIKQSLRKLTLSFGKPADKQATLKYKPGSRQSNSVIHHKKPLHFSQSIMNNKPHLTNPPPILSLSTGHAIIINTNILRPISPAYSSDSSLDGNQKVAFSNMHTKTKVSSHVSSASSSSGIVLNYRRFSVHDTGIVNK